ncbi:Calx-beta domain-containing protein, partial [Lyngbya sp. CCY1209]|uniref:Calx-beta domain-containing protein n=1 Tax=Lyngbya sp. CCY1209 TaxID=2886103 RepID=UPI002D21013A
SERGTATILDDDWSAPELPQIDISGNDDEPLPNISVSNRRITEGNRGRKNAKFAVTLDSPSSETVSVDYTTVNKTAKANQDYKRTQDVLTFQPGETTQ